MCSMLHSIRILRAYTHEVKTVGESGNGWDTVCNKARVDVLTVDIIQTSR